MLSLNAASEQTATSSQKGLAAVFYGVSSLAIMFVNKFVLTSFSFPSYTFLAMIQFVVTVLILRVQAWFGTVKIAKFEWTLLREIFPLPFLFLLNTLTGLGATKTINMPMFVLLRRFSIVMTILLEAWILNKYHSRKVHMAVGLMVFGALLAAINDFTIDILGYFLIMLNNAFTAMNGVLLRRNVDLRDKLTTEGIMFYNTLFSLPVLLVFMAVFQRAEMHKVLYLFPLWHNPAFLFFLGCSGVMGFVLNYSYYLCTTVNSPLTTTVVGCLKNVLSTYFGMLLGDYVYSALNFVGLNISVFGSLLYSYAEYVKIQQQNKVKEESISKSPTKGDRESPGGKV